MIADRINQIQESGSIALAQKVTELRTQGHKIISLSIGEPDFPPHPDILQATKDALDRHETKYSLVHGIIPLRQAIATKMKRDHQIEVGVENILVSNGSKQTLYSLFQALINPGDEVLVPAPYWVTIPEAIRLAGGVPVFVTSENLLPNIEALQKAVTPKTRAIIINSPNNPTGLMIPQKLMEELGAFVIKNDLLLISDEAYEVLTFDTKHISPASLSPELFDRTLTVQSFSKSYCMTGFRIGYVVGPKKYIHAMYKLQSHLTGNNCTFAQYGALKALELPLELLEDYRQVYQKRRDYAYERAIKIFQVEKPQGAFFLFPNVSNYLEKRFKTSDEMALYLLEEAKVALLPGSFFGLDPYLRISFATNLDELREAFDRIEKALL